MVAELRTVSLSITFQSSTGVQNPLCATKGAQSLAKTPNKNHYELKIQCFDTTTLIYW